MPGDNLMPVTLPLGTPIEAHGETLKELSFRDLTAKDIRTIGYPFIITKDAETAPDAAAVARYIVALAAIPSSSVDRLSPMDFMAATGAVMGFFAAPTAG